MAVGVDIDGATDKVRGVLPAALLVLEKSKKMQGIRLIGLLSQDLPITSGGLFEAAGLVMLQSDFQCLLERHCMHFYRGTEIFSPPHCP